MSSLWWGRANKGKTNHLWSDDKTLCGLTGKTRHPWLDSSRRCSQCLQAFSTDAALQAEYEVQNARRVLARASQ